ncbi:tRNA-modifying protein YgfZ [Orbus sturtevantii]|uniref:tRNA-modifying protein YgfZ n=1 Tax=Orbus sturtevantii TaxID=3074109 RepID=UPI00370DBA59
MLHTSQVLPLSKISLTDWQLIKVSGVDNSKFLQGQLTSDMNKLTDKNFLFAAQCEPKGKVLSNMLLFKQGDDIYYIERESVVDTQLKELKKYAVFSKVTFNIDTDLTIIGIAGNSNHHQLTEIAGLFNDAQNCTSLNDLTYLRINFPTPRYIIIGKEHDINQLALVKECQVQSAEQWALLDLEANYPIIDMPLTNEYLPQAFNLQNFDAINFDKGCYCGQEMVARAQYRGINKRALYLLAGQSEKLPVIGDTLEQKMDENWRETGRITATLRLNDQSIWVQAILNNDLDTDTIFRVKNSPTSQLALKQVK